VDIGTQTWMAENLRYYLSSSMDSDECPGESTSNCAKYGRLYRWATAMNGGTSSTANPSGVRGICPTGWHLPSMAEWNTLGIYIGENPGIKLKATSGWSGGANGTDDYGFAALPGGYIEGGSVNDKAHDFNVRGYWWTSTQYNASYAYDLGMGSTVAENAGLYTYGAEANNYSWAKKDMLSVRCVKN